MISAASAVGRSIFRWRVKELSSQSRTEISTTLPHRPCLRSRSATLSASTVTTLCASWSQVKSRGVVVLFPTDFTGTTLIPIDQGKDVVFTQKRDYWTGTLDKGTLTKGKELLTAEAIRKAGLNIKKQWADKDGLYLMGYMKNDKGENQNVVRQYSLQDGQLIQSFEGPLTKEGRGYAVTEHRVVLGQEGGIYWIYRKKDGKLLGKFKTEPKLTMEILTPMKNDSILIYRRISREKGEAKLYRMDL